MNAYTVYLATNDAPISIDAARVESDSRWVSFYATTDTSIEPVAQFMRECVVGWTRS